MAQFILVHNNIVNADTISHIDCYDLENMRVTVHFKDHKTASVLGPQAIDLVMALKPSAFEGRRMSWPRHQWSVHNLVGHPFMQLLAYLKMYKLAIKVHEITTPRPRDGIKKQ